MLHCIFCGNYEFKPLFFVDRHLVKKCVHCDLVQTSAAEAETHVNTLYDMSYFQGLTERKPQEMYYQNRLLHLIEQYKSPGKILEIGIGIGIFMELAHERGWEIEGVDPSQDICQYVSEALHLPVHQGYLEAIRLSQSSFDVVTLRHVLEHVSQPKQFVHELHRILKDDGVVCLAVPNFDGLHSRIEKGKWFHLSLPYHVAHYTAKTLRLLLTDCDFEIIRLQTLDISCSSYLIQLVNIFLNLFKQKPLNIYINPHEIDSNRDLARWVVSKETIFNNLMARFGFGEEIVVIARKK